MTDYDSIRQTLRTYSAYIADGDFCDRLTWFETLDFDRVITKDALTEYENEQRAWMQGPPDARAPAPPPPATLSAIVRLRSGPSYYLTACTSWKPGRGAFSFESIRPTAIADDPRVPELDGDFKSGWENIVQLIKNHVPSDGANPSQATGAIAHRANASQGFKVTHKVFEKRQINGEDDIDPDPAFRIENWPIEHEEARTALNRLKTTHIARPIPAYNVFGLRIHPTRYKDELKGAIVRLEFNLNRSPTSDGGSSYLADIATIRVLVPPPPFDFPSPKKRAPQRDPFDALPLPGRAPFPARLTKESIKRESPRRHDQV